MNSDGLSSKNYLLPVNPCCSLLIMTLSDAWDGCALRERTAGCSPSTMAPNLTPAPFFPP